MATSSRNTTSTPKRQVPKIADDVTHIWNTVKWVSHDDVATGQQEVITQLRAHTTLTLNQWSDKIVSTHEATCEHHHPAPPVRRDNGLTVDQAVEQVIAEGGDGELIASEAVVRESLQHLGLIHNEIHKLSGYLPDTDPGDLVGFGWRGLRVALRQFDPSLGYTFATFACPKINGAIRDGVRAEHHLPKRLTTFARKVSSAEQELMQQLNRPVTFSDISDYLQSQGVPMVGEDIVARLNAPASLEEMLSVPRADLQPLIDYTDPAHEAELAARREDLLQGLHDLPELERQIVVDVFVKGLSLTTAAGNANVDVRAARALRTSALASLRQSMEHWVS